MKFEIFDSQKNDYLIVGYRSDSQPDLFVFAKISFAYGTSEAPLDYGYGDNETHTSEKVDVYLPESIEFEYATYEDGDIAKLTDEQNNLLEEEANNIFNKYFSGYEYDDLRYDINTALKKSYSKGGVVLSKFFANTNRFFPYNGNFLYPPRIESRLQPISLDKFDNGNYIGQPKLNGSSTSVTISEKSVVAKERHNKFFAIPPKFDFQSLHRGNGFMCITGEFMNKSKKDQDGKPLKVFCIWDIVAYDGKILIGSTIEERMNLLNKLYPTKSEIKTKNGVPYLLETGIPDIYKVNNFYGRFSELFNDLTSVDMVEGFVLKRKNGKLEMMTREENNTGWSVKVRKPTSNYKFDDGGAIKKYEDLSKKTTMVINENDSVVNERIDEVELNIKRKGVDIKSPKKIEDAPDAVNIFKELWDSGKLNVYEELNVLLLNNNNEVIGYYQHTKGGVNQTLVDIELICAMAIKALAKGVIVAHNHPSGNLMPSTADKAFTSRLKEALKLFEITLLDSIIITKDSYFSFQNKNLMERGGNVGI